MSVFRSLLRGRVLLLTLSAVLLAALAAVSVSTLAWADEIRSEGRMLPGTTIAGIEVGGLAEAEVASTLGPTVENLLDRSVTVRHGDQSWDVTVRDLGAATDVDVIVGQAVQQARDTGLLQLTRLRWTGEEAGIDLHIEPVLPDGAIEQVIDAIADELDTAAGDASATWDGDGFDVAASRDGLRVDRAASTSLLRSALEDGEIDEVELVTEVVAPEITDAAIEAATAEAAVAVDAALDRQITLTYEDASWSVTVRELGKVRSADPLVEAALAGRALPVIGVDLDDDAVARRMAEIADQVHVPSRNASAEVKGGDLVVTNGQVGRRLDQEASAAGLRTAVADGHDVVELGVHTIQPAITSASFDGRLLVVDQAARELHLYEGRKPVRTWPVAVGSGGSPTPTGMFTIGAKRFEPTWVNPSPNGWGSHMPARIGPGPENPLGTRALNWNRDGRDTLIRFHGTPNEDSIGQAASQGCVRMYNRDVEELYDLVSTGTVVLSIGG
jgi:lipoprotein-anchoring transpeptidase ErfK/SrfK